MKKTINSIKWVSMARCSNADREAFLYIVWSHCNQSAHSKKVPFIQADQDRHNKKKWKIDGQMMTRTRAEALKSSEESWQPMKGFLAWTEPAASQLDVHQLTSDTGVEMSCLFHIYSQHSLQPQSSISFPVSSALMKLKGYTPHTEE